MGVGRQQRGPFQGVRVKNSVKELLLHIRSNKQKTSGQSVDEFKVVASVLCFEWVGDCLSLLFANLGPVSHLQFFIDDQVPRTGYICAVLLALGSAPSVYEKSRNLMSKQSSLRTRGFAGFSTKRPFLLERHESDGLTYFILTRIE